MRHLLVIVAMLSLAPLHVQGEAPASASNPTRLRVAVKAADVLLSWEAVADAAGGWAIYRSVEQPSEANFAKAVQLAVAAPADRSYSTTPPDRKAYFYSVLALDAAKKPLLSFVPGKSVTAVGIANENAPAAIAAPLPAPSTGPSSPISALRSASLPDSVKLSFVVAAGTGSVLVYRGLAPFADAGSLLDAVLIATIPDGVKEFVDYPVPGQSYYYALVSEAALKAGKIEFKAGANATQNPATIATTALYGALPETGDLARITPLPSNLFGSQNDRNTPPRAAALAADTEKAISAILAPFPPPRPLPPALTVLVEDKAQAKGGEDYALSLIIQGPLKREDYAAAIDQLQRYLSLNRSKAVASRAHFYLGQAYAKSGSYRDAFFEFLQARDLHASESRPWILYVIAVLRS